MQQREPQPGELQQSRRRRGELQRGELRRNGWQPGEVQRSGWQRGVRWRRVLPLSRRTWNLQVVDFVVVVLVVGGVVGLHRPCKGENVIKSKSESFPDLAPLLSLSEASYSSSSSLSSSRISSSSSSSSSMSASTSSETRPPWTKNGKVEHFMVLESQSRQRQRNTAAEEKMEIKEGKEKRGRSLKWQGGRRRRRSEKNEEVYFHHFPSRERADIDARWPDGNHRIRLAKERRTRAKQEAKEEAPAIEHETGEERSVVEAKGEVGEGGRRRFRGAADRRRRKDYVRRQKGNAAAVIAKEKQKPKKMKAETENQTTGGVPEENRRGRGWETREEKMKMEGEITAEELKEDDKVEVEREEEETEEKIVETAQEMVLDAAAGDISRVEKEIDSLATNEEEHEDLGLNATQFYQRLNSDNSSCNESCPLTCSILNERGSVLGPKCDHRCVFLCQATRGMPKAEAEKQINNEFNLWNELTAVEIVKSTSNMIEKTDDERRKSKKTQNETETKALRETKVKIVRKKQKAPSTRKTATEVPPAWHNPGTRRRHGR